MLLQIICKTEIVSKSVKLYFRAFLFKTSELFLGVLKFSFIFKFHKFGVKKDHFSKKVKNKNLDLNWSYNKNIIPQKIQFQVSH